MKDRVIIHGDINHCFAQIEELKNPQLRQVPMAVAGDPRKRHGIILARNLEARKFGIRTAESLSDAYRKCPHLVVVKPNSEEYRYYSEKVKTVFREYTDHVESFGIDEAWLDVTHSQLLFGDGVDIARMIQKRVLNEVGLMISVGVSWNKIFAKLGSDLKKPYGFTVITKMNYQEVIWNLPVEALMGVGRQSAPKFHQRGIMTIGDLARTDLKTLVKLFGKMGRDVWNYAHGVDESEVSHAKAYRQPKSLGNSTTTPKDIMSFQEARIVLTRLAENVSARMRSHNLVGNTISVNGRDDRLKSFAMHHKLNFHTDVVSDMVDEAMVLLEERYQFWKPLRSLGVSISGLKKREAETIYLQLNLFEDVSQSIRNRQVDLTIEQIRQRFGYESVKKASMLLDERLAGENPREILNVLPYTHSEK